MKKQLLKTIPLLLVIGLLIPALTAIAAPLYAGVNVTADSTAKSGIPGSVVTYTITVENTTTDATNITVSANSASGWTAPVVNPSALSLAPKTPPADPPPTKGVVTSVPIPPTATSGQNDITTVTITDSTHTETSTLQFVTTASIPSPVGRPIIVITSYSAGDKPIYAGQEMNLSVVALGLALLAYLFSEL